MARCREAVKSRRMAKTLTPLGVGLLLFSSITTTSLRVMAQGTGNHYIESALVQVSTGSPFPQAGHGDPDHIRSQPGHNYYNTTVEPFVAINPTNINNVVAVWQQDRWDNGGCRGIIAGVSFDGGTTWQDVVVPGFTLASGDGGVFQRTSDPWVSFAPNGDVYVSGLAIDGTDSRSGVEVSKSTDGGLTWSTPTLLIDDNDPNVLNDKDAVTADSTDAHYAYVVWDRIDLNGQPPEFTRTTDGGQTWETPRAIGPAGATLGNQIVVMPRGVLLDFFTEFTSNNIYLSLIRSTDKGATWLPQKATIRVSNEQTVGVTDPETGAGIRDGGILASVAVNPHTGYLYAVWEDGRFSNGQINGIAFSISTNGGFAWSKPIQINKTPTNIPLADQQAFTPAISVAADGTIAVSYFDFRNNATLHGSSTDCWMIFCKPSKTHHATDPNSWGSERRLTNTSFNITKAPSAGGYFLGDYAALAVGGPYFVSIFPQPDGTGAQFMYYRGVKE